MSTAADRHRRPDRRDDRAGTALTLLGVAAAVVVVVVVVADFLGVGQLVNDDDADVPVTATQEVQQGQLTEQAFADVEPGSTKEDLLAGLRPVQPVDAAVLDRDDLRAPETASASCVYYEGQDLPDEALYRFCFEDDVLVDKTFVLQTGPGTGAALSAS